MRCSTGYTAVLGALSPMPNCIEPCSKLNLCRAKTRLLRLAIGLLALILAVDLACAHGLLPGVVDQDGLEWLQSQHLRALQLLADIFQHLLVLVGDLILELNSLSLLRFLFFRFVRGVLLCVRYEILRAATSRYLWLGRSGGDFG